MSESPARAQRIAASRVFRRFSRGPGEAYDQFRMLSLVHTHAIHPAGAAPPCSWSAKNCQKQAPNSSAPVNSSRSQIQQMQSEQTTPKGISLSGLSEEEQIYLSGLSEEEQLHANFPAQKYWKCCAHPGCQNIQLAKTLCKAHYEAKRIREKEAEFSSMLQKGLASNCCAHPGCRKKQHSKTLCKAHYDANYRREKAAEFSSMLQKGRAPKCCAHPGCQKMHHSKTLCQDHYNAKFRREKAAEFSSMLQKGLAPKCCAHPGCQKMQVAKTLCHVHYEAKRNREKAACCAHPGCQNMQIHAKTLCQAHYRAALRRGANPHPLPLRLAVAKIQTQKTTKKLLARRFETNESEIRELVTQKYTGEIKPKLEEGIGGDGVAAGTVPEPTLQAHYKAVQRRGGQAKTNHPLPLHLAVAKLQTQKTTNKRLARRVVTNESEIRALVTQEYTGGIKPKLEEGIFY
jgi:hypothetical protein